MKELDLLRLNINNIDSKIVFLYEERLNLCQKISSVKKDQNLPIFNKDREQKLKEINYSLIKNHSHLMSYQFFFDNILFLSKEYQSLNNLPSLYKEIIITCKEIFLKQIISKEQIVKFIIDKLNIFNIKIEEYSKTKNNSLSFWIDESSFNSIFFSHIIDNKVIFSVAFNINNNDLFYTFENILFHNYSSCNPMETKHKSAIDIGLLKNILSTSLNDTNELIKKFNFAYYINTFDALSLLQKGLINFYLTETSDYLINLLKPLNFQTKTIKFNQTTINLILKEND